MSTSIDEASIRITALDMAIKSEPLVSGGVPASAKAVVNRAEEYRAFIEGEA